MKKNKYIIIIFVALIISIIGFLLLNTKKYTTQTEIQNNTQDITVSLNTLDKNYSVKVEKDATVYDVMKNAEKEGFSFLGREYPQLGFFVDEINGIKNESNKYWIYYVNETEASVGVSKYIIKEGDIISWKQE